MKKQLLKSSLWRGLLSLLFLMAMVGNAWGETYTIDFNKGTTNGTNISSSIPAVATLCQSGSDNISAVNTSSNCYYNASGCGVRLAKSGGAGTFKITLSNTIQAATVSKVVVYASKVSDNTTSTLKVTPTGTVTTATDYNNSALSAYSTSSSASTNYELSEITINGTLSTLQFEAPSKGYVMLHRIDIVTGEADTRTAVNMSTFTTAGGVTSIVKGNTLATSVTNDQSGWTAAYTYSSDKESVATVDANGVITAVAKGTATIKAALNVAKDDASYKAGTTTSKEIEITVTNPTHKVYFSTNGSFLKEDGDEYEEGAAITFPAETPADVNGKKFVGWYGSTYSNATTAPTYVTSATMGEDDVTYYAVYAYQAGDGVPVESLSQTLKYDTWTYGGSTTDMSSYRLFHNGGYIESASFNLSQLSKVVVYGGTFGGTSYKNLTIGDGTNTWKSVTVSGSSETGTNTYTNGTALTGTGTLKITSGSGTASGSGVRISKVEIYTTTPGYTYSGFETTVSAAVESTVTLNTNGGTINAGDVTAYTEGIGATLPTDVTKTGYTFAGWYADEELSGDAVTAIGADATGNKEYWAKWTAYTYTVKFNANGGTGEMSDQSFTYDEDAKALTANAFTKTGYSFAGWATTADGEKAYDDEAEVKNLTSTDKATVNLYALWSVNSYTLAWSYDNSECQVTEDGTEAGEVEFGTALTAPTLKRKGYSLSWDPDVPATMPADNVTYTAVWTAKYYNVTFDKNAEDATGTMEPQSIQFDASATLTANAFVYPGHSFKGWATSSEGYKDYEDEAEYTMQEEGVTLYAVWEENDKYTLTWSVNGHETTEDVAEGLPISFNAPTENIPEGKVFRGWYADGDYSNATDEPTYVTEATMPGQNITYYAVFATKTGSEPQPASTTINSSTENFPTSYAAAADVTLNGISFKVTQAYVNGTKLQWRASGNSNGTGAMYNNDALQSIQSIVLTYDGDSYKNFTVNVGSSANPTSGTSITGVVDANNNNVYTYDCSSANADYFVLTNGTNAGYLSSIKINYLSGGGYTYKDFTTTVVIRTLTGIEITGTPNLEYTEEQYFNPAGIQVMASYEDGGDQEDVTTSAELSYNTNPLTTSDTQIIVNASLGGFNAEPKTYDINVSAIPTYTVTIVAPENGTLTVKNGENAVNSGDALRAGTVLNITATAAEGYKFRNLQVVDGSTHTFTASNEKEWTLGAINTTIKANFDIINQYQVTWMANGTQLKQETVYENVGSAAPEVTCPTGYTLAGWSTTEANEETTTAPTFATLTEGNFMPEAATTLYAVYTRSEGGSTQISIAASDAPTTYDATDKTFSNVTFKFDGAGVVAGEDNGIQFRSTKKGNAMMYNTSELPQSISSVVLTYQGTTYGDLTVSAGASSNTKTVSPEAVVSGENSEIYTFNFSTNDFKYVVIENTVQNARQIKSIEINCGNGVGTTYYTTDTNPLYSEVQSLTLVATSNDYYYATFSNSNVTFFPETDNDTYLTDVEKVNVINGTTLELTSLDKGTASIGGSDVEGFIVPANTGILLKVYYGATIPYYTITNKTVDALENNMLRASTVAMEGDYKFYRLAYYDNTNKKGLGFYYGYNCETGGAFTCKAGTAYLAVPNGGNGSVKGFSFEDINTVIQISTADIDDAAIYNLNGQRVNKAQKGIYIKNGKKFLVK